MCVCVHKNDVCERACVSRCTWRGYKIPCRVSFLLLPWHGAQRESSYVMLGWLEPVPMLSHLAGPGLGFWGSQEELLFIAWIPPSPILHGVNNTRNCTGKPCTWEGQQAAEAESYRQTTGKEDRAQPSKNGDVLLDSIFHERWNDG